MSDRLEKLMDFHRKDPEDTFVRYGIALEYRSLGKMSEALQWLDGLRRDFPGYVATYYQLALTLNDLGKRREALEAITQGIRAAKNEGDGHTVSELHALRGEFEDDD